MSEQVKTKEKIDLEPKYLMRLTLILLGFSAFIALLLGVVYGITAPMIQTINDEKKAVAMSAVVEDSASEFSPLDMEQGAIDAAFAYNKSKLTGMYDVVVGGETVGFVCEVTVGGSQGDISMVVGLDASGVVTGTSIIKMNETAGLGTKANDDTWRAQYVGGGEPFAVDKDGGTIQAITGATVSSRAVTNGVNAAIDAVKTLG